MHWQSAAPGGQHNPGQLSLFPEAKKKCLKVLEEFFHRFAQIFLRQSRLINTENEAFIYFFFVQPMSLQQKNLQLSNTPQHFQVGYVFIVFLWVILPSHPTHFVFKRCFLDGFPRRGEGRRGHGVAELLELREHLVRPLVTWGGGQKSHGKKRSSFIRLSNP